MLTMQAHCIEAGATIETTYSASICRLAAQGLGVGVVNPYVASVFARDLRILALHPPCAVEVVLAVPSRFAPSERAETFVQLLREELAQTPAGPGQAGFADNASLSSSPNPSSV
ncbi:MAG: LysR substrate-binding domain-containing protein [Acidovorax soli]|uniref:LysR substrate-binding domain-containing protein n=1 Tax=Acidovorax soli TaxID=592050 RepID=UPI0026EB8071|nr:LysR substrate-binding domain-containing protein [Acidovorax soli]MCM2348286.1 LysR substrate-binding domain-containing protein [Acidovorax soli]